MRTIIRLFGQLLAPSSRRFKKALLNPQTAQQKVQVSIVQRLIQSEYGKSLGIKSVADWSQIPIVEYHELETWIHLQLSKNPLLTPEPIIFYEKTSGSRSAAKLIPYTKSLRSSFNQMFCVWAYDLIAHVFFEFEDEAGKIFYLHEIAIGGVYEMILSQKGGLYRYRIGDRVRVSHFYLKTPCLEFIGRKALISDFTILKLSIQRQQLHWHKTEHQGTLA